MFDSIQRMIHKLERHSVVLISPMGGGIGNWENYPQGVLQGNTSGASIYTTLS